MASPVDVSSNESDFLQSSPIYQCPAIDSLKEEDSSETPLQTPWTLWLDKWVFYALHLLFYFDLDKHNVDCHSCQ